MSERDHARIGASNRTRGKTTERAVAKYLHEHGLGDGRRNLAGYARDHGDYGPVIDRDGDLWAVEIKGPGAQPQPGQVEAWAAEAAREADHAGAPLWVLIVRRPGCADVGRWWAYLPLWALYGDRGAEEQNPVVWGDLACVTLRAWVALVAPELEVVS
jgi:hypothetical protein